MQPGAWSAGYWLIVIAMWWVMMIAMMTPSAAPMILLYGRATRHAQAGGRLTARHGADGGLCCRLPPGMARVLGRGHAADVGAGAARASCPA